MDGLQNPAFEGSESTAGDSPSKTRPVGVVRPVQSNGAGGDAGSLSHVKVEDGGELSTCGWGPFKPKCLQVSEYET